MNYLDFNRLLYKLIDDNDLDNNGKIKEEIKYRINNSKFNIQNSKFVGELGDKFETLLFLPPNPERKGEGGLRTKGLFKFSYKKVRSEKLEVRNDLGRNDKNVNESESVWYICDFYGNPLIPVPSSHLSLLTSHLSLLTSSPLTSLPLITVITVVYNGAKYLEDTIKSVINQTYPNVEYIIIDGGSTDGTIDIIKKYEDYIDYWVSEPDKGIYDAMNKGIKVAIGEYFVFLGSDDIMINSWFINAINYTMKFSRYKKNKENYYIYGNIVFLSNNKKILYKYNQLKDILVLKKEFIIPHSGSIISAKLFRSYSLYDDKYRIIGDYAWVLKVIENTSFLYIDSFQIEMRLGGTSNSYKTISMILKESKLLEKDFRIRLSKKYKFKNIIKYIFAKFMLFEKFQHLYWQIKSLIFRLK
jgi:glycosyltransferase involved in cell wall biosynthesis